MANETDKPKSSLFSKALGWLEVAVAGGFSAARYVRHRVDKNLQATILNGHAPTPSIEKARALQIQADLKNPETVLGKAFEAFAATAEGKAVENAIGNGSVRQLSTLAEKQTISKRISSGIAKEIPLKEKLLMRNLHLTGAEKAKAGLVFATVGAVSGYAAYKVASWLHKDNSEIQR